MDQGEFYVYSPDGGIEGVDTIKVIDGRFTYEAPCKDKFTLMIVFPNFSEQPVFAEPGQSVDIKADASHLKELTVKGSKDNELMNSFREQILNVSPPEETRIAEQFIKDNPASVVSVFLVRKYFVAALSPDYAKASQLLSLLSKEQPDNGNIARLTQKLKWLKSTGIGSQLPVFTAYDTNGKLISSTSLASAPVAVITFFRGFFLFRHLQVDVLAGEKVLAQNAHSGTYLESILNVARGKSRHYGTRHALIR